MHEALTIIIPVYNEAGNLERLETELDEYIKSCQYPVKVLLVNDGSSDNSLEMIEQICRRNHYFNFISFQQNAGLTAAIKAGFDAADTPLVGYMDADLQTSPQDFNLLIGELNGCAMVNGVRQGRKDSYVKNTSSRIANSIRRAFTHDGMEDTGCPLKIVRAEYAKRIPMFNGLHRFLPAMVQLQGGTVKQVPVRHFPRIAGKSNFGLSNRLLGPLTDCFAFLWMKKKYIRYNIEKQGHG